VQASVCDMSILLKNQTSAALHAALADAGVTPRLARQLQVAAVRRDEFPAVGPDAPARVIEKVRALARIPQLKLLGKTVSARDGFAKYVFQGDGPDPFEAVRIPLLHRPDDPKYVVCVSSQVGCAMGCIFCATGRMGWRRNLAPWEMVDQVARIQADSAHPVRGVVFMGMGEPMLNYDAVLTAAAVLSEPCGMAISAKAITLSTAGIVAGIRRFTAEHHAYRLIVSLNSADPAGRLTLMPVEAANPTPGLMQALREYHAVSGQRVTLAWTMIAGVNTRPEDARMLAELTRGLPVKLDLLDVNDTSGRFQPPSPEELSTFRDALRQHLAMPVSRRYSGGQDIHAACGMLAAPACALPIE
jgi:23S rRNA (adenine2503-C2)-methyltransferase